MSDAPLTSAALFDTRSEFARDLPLELIAAWMNGSHTIETANKLLDPYRVTGTAVVSDSVGLTRLARRRDPLEVMALLNQPKELVYQFGTAIGGSGMGVWAADNTEMFYPDHVKGEQIASMLLSVQDRIRKECEVQIGMGVHYDSFFLVDNALYGAAANAIECLAEDRTEGGEIVLTPSAWNRTCEQPFEFRSVSRAEITCEFSDGIRLLDGPRLDWPEGASKHYPLPFSEEFYECLGEYYRHCDLVQLRKKVTERFTRHCTVLLVEREPIEADTAEERVLREMTIAAIAHARGAWLLASTSGMEVKTAGSLSIYVFDEASEAWKFAVQFRAVLEREQIRTRSGFATGEVLIFELEAGGREINGSPVNMASKVAQDQGEFGRIYAVETLPEKRVPSLDVAELSFFVGGCEIPVWVA